MKSNRTQIFANTASVAGTTEAVGKYGIASQLAYNISQRGKEVKRDIEAALVGRDQALVTGSSSTAAKMASVINQIDSGVTETITGGALTEAGILDAHQKAYNAGGDPSILMTNPNHATTIAGFATASGRQRDFATSTELVNFVDLMVTPFGQVSVVLNRFQSADDVLLVDPEYLEVGPCVRSQRHAWPKPVTQKRSCSQSNHQRRQARQCTRSGTHRRLITHG